MEKARATLVQWRGTWKDIPLPPLDPLVPILSVVDGAVPTHTAALGIGLLHPGASARREITFALGALGDALGGPEVLGYSGLSLDGISMLAVRFASEPYVSDLYADIEQWPGFASGDVEQCPDFILPDSLAWDFQTILDANAIAIGTIS